MVPFCEARRKIVKIKTKDNTTNLLFNNYL